MKVIPNVTVIDRIRADLAAVISGRRTPDYVVVTEDEYKELREDPRVWQCLEPSWMMPISATETPAETTFETKTFERRGPCDDHYRTIHAVSHEKFEGVPLYVVPKEYHP
jgi:hypothetical protein